MIETIKIIIAEDHLILRESIVKNLASKGIETIAQVSNGQQLLNSLENTMPDVVVLDLNMPVLDGNKTFDLIQQHYPGTKIIILSFHCYSVLVKDYMKRGAMGFMPKHKADELLSVAIKTVYNGYKYTPTIEPEYEMKFTIRQEMILPSLCAALSNKEIAAENRLTERAIEKQKSAIFKKFNVENAAGFYKVVYYKGLQFLSMKNK